MLTVKLRRQKWNELVENEQRNENNKKFLKNKDDLVVNERKEIYNSIINRKKSIVNDRIINLQGHQNDDEIKFGKASFKSNNILLNNKLLTNENISDEENYFKNVSVKENNLEQNTDQLSNLIDYKLIKTTSDSLNQISKSIEKNSHDLTDGDLNSSLIDQKLNQFYKLKQQNQINFNRKIESNKIESDNQLVYRTKIQNIKNFKRSVSDLSNVILRKNYPPKNQLINENDVNNCSNHYSKNSIDKSYREDLKFTNSKLINESDTSFSSELNDDDVDKVQRIFEQIERLNSEINRKTDHNSLEIIKRSKRNLTSSNKERNSLALSDVSNQLDYDLKLDHIIDESIKRRSFYRSSFNSKLKIDNLKTNQQITNQINCSKINCKNINFIKLKENTEKLAKTNNQTIFDTSINNTKNYTRLGISSLRTELNKKMLNNVNLDLNKNELKDEFNDDFKTINDKFSELNMNQINKLNNKKSSKEQMNTNLVRHISLPQLNIKDDKITKLNSINCLSDLNYELSTAISPVTPSKNCFSLPRSFCLNRINKKLLKNDNKTDNQQLNNFHKLGSFNSKTNRLKSFFKTKLTNLNSNNQTNLDSNSQVNNTIINNTTNICITNLNTVKRLYRQESFSDNDDVNQLVEILNNNNSKLMNCDDKLNLKNNLSDKMNKSDDNKLNRSFAKRISKKLNKQNDDLISPDLIDNYSINDSMDNFLDNNLLNNLDNYQKKLLLNKDKSLQRSTSRFKNRFPFILNASNRITRNQSSCQSSFSSADSGHTSVPSSSSFSSTNLARSLSFNNETPTSDLYNARLNKLKLEEDGSLSSTSSTTNTDSLLVNFNNKSNLLIETFCKINNDVDFKKLMDKNQII